jgi:hypothetical protein
VKECCNNYESKGGEGSNVRKSNGMERDIFHNMRDERHQTPPT